MPNERSAGAPPHAEAERYELVGRIAGGVAHDLNNRLSTVTTFADLLLARCEPGSSMAEDLAEIKEAGVEAAEVLRRLQLFARPGRHAPETLEVAEVARSMAPLLSRVLGPSIELRVSVREHAASVCAPRPRIEELLLALVGLARRSMPRGGALALEIGTPRTAGTAVAGIEALLPSGTGITEGALGLLESLVSELGGTAVAGRAADGRTAVRVTLPADGDGADHRERPTF